MPIGRRQFCSVVLLVLILFGSNFSATKHSGGHLHYLTATGNATEPAKWYCSSNICRIRIWSSQFWTNDTSQSFGNYSDASCTLLFLLSRDANNYPVSATAHFGHSNVRSGPMITKIRRFKSPCSYCPKSVATFHCILNVDYYGFSGAMIFTTS